MSPDEFIAEPEFESGIKQEVEEAPEEEVVAIIEEPTEEELEAEPVLEAEEQEVGMTLSVFICTR
jgi:hypothetical protein